MTVFHRFLGLLVLFIPFSLRAETPNSIIFTDIYQRGEWGVDKYGKGNSGTGADPIIAKRYINFLQHYLIQQNIHSVVDLGCGDWRISECIDWGNIHYLGVDVVQSVIDKNIERFSSPNIMFLHADGTRVNLPNADLLICKDVLQHLPFTDIFAIISQFKKFRYCIIVNDVDPMTLTCINRDIPRGCYRFVDLTQPPFCLTGQKVLTYVGGGEGEVKQVLIIQ